MKQRIKRITGVTAEDIEKAGLAEVEKITAIMFWIEKLSVGEIAQKRKVKNPSVCLTLNAAQEKLLKLKEFPFAEKKSAEKKRGLSERQTTQLRKGVLKDIVVSIKKTAKDLMKLAKTLDANSEKNPENRSSQLHRAVIELFAKSLEEIAQQLETKIGAMPVFQSPISERKTAVPENGNGKGRKTRTIDLPEEDESSGELQPLDWAVSLGEESATTEEAAIRLSQLI